MVGIAAFDRAMQLNKPIRNPETGRLADKLKTGQVKSLAGGNDALMADLKESMHAPPKTIDGHSYAIVVFYNYNRDPKPDEAGNFWTQDAQSQRAYACACETAIILVNYLRVFGFDAKAYSGASTDVDLNKLAVAAGLASVEYDTSVNPFIGDRFQLAVVTTNFEMAPDAPLAPLGDRPKSITRGIAWSMGRT